MTDKDPGSAEDRRRQEMGKWMGIGIAVGAGIGVVMQSLAVGMGIGVALGVAMGSYPAKKIRDCNCSRFPSRQR